MIKRRLFIAALSLSVFALVGCKPTDSGSSAGTTGDAGTTGATGTATAEKSPYTTGETIKIGHYAAMTGGTAAYGQDTDAGVKMAMEEINAEGGVLGKKIEVDTQDDESKPEGAITVATKMSADAKILVAIGEVASGRTIPAAPFFDKAGIPMVSPSATNPDVTKKGTHIFRICFIDPFQGLIVSKFVKDNLKFTKAAIFTDKKNEYSTGLTEVINKEFTGMGGQIVAQASYQEGDSDFRAQLGQLKTANPEAIFVPGYYKEVGMIARQAREMGITAPLIGGDGWNGDGLIAGAGGPGKALEGSFFTDHYSPEDPNPLVQDFVKKFTEKNKRKPSANAALGYDTLKLVADAIKRTGKEDREAVTKAISETKDFEGVTGKITIDADRNANKKITILKIVGNEFKFEASVDPPK
jgi:branched-chain amino acid transport system substrate-binding protein